MLMKEIPSPKELKELYPLSDTGKELLDNNRTIARNICEGKDRRVVGIVGPCSIHDLASALVYGRLLHKLSARVEKHLFLVMRVFTEKPRTQAGWKGLLYDPHLDGSHDIATGLRWTRKILVQLAELGIACSREFVDPVIAPYFNDLLTWGMIGARTPESQPHRQLASSLPFPVGFKNAVDGRLEPALQGIQTAKASHTYMQLAEDGKIATTKSYGNPHAHLVLRGSDLATNYDTESIHQAINQLKVKELNARIVLDCSHGNCQKKHELQPVAFQSVLQQILEGNSSIMGFMLESHLFEGKQTLSKELDQLKYGISITDPCISWQTTEKLIMDSFEALEKSARSKAGGPKTPTELLPR